MISNDDLQAIGGILSKQKTEIIQESSEMMDTKLGLQKTEIMQDVSVLMESKFMPMFNLLVEGQQAIIDRLIPVSRIEAIEEEMSLLKTVVRQLSEDLQRLKKAQ